METTKQQQPNRFLIFSALLRNDSLNTQLAKLAALNKTVIHTPVLVKSVIFVR